MTVAEMIARLEDYPGDMKVMRYIIHNGKVEGFKPYDPDAFAVDEAVPIETALGGTSWRLPDQWVRRNEPRRVEDILVLF